MAALKPQSIGILAVVVLLLGGSFFIYYSSSKKLFPLISVPTVQNAPYTVEVAPDSSSIKAGDTVRLHFTTYKDGALADINSEQRVLHYVIASSNFRDFFHTFTPEVKGPGQFYLDHTFTQPGAYRIWTELVDTTKSKELHHGEHAEIVSYVDLTVEGERATAVGPLVTAADAWADRWHVVTERQGLKAGSPTTITMHVEDSEGTILPVFPAEPAIYVMVGDDFDFFRHTHTQPALEGNLIRLTETFPEAGTYLFFTEIYVQDGGAYQVVQVPFQLNIAK